MIIYDLPFVAKEYWISAQAMASAREKSQYYSSHWLMIAREVNSNQTNLIPIEQIHDIFLVLPNYISLKPTKYICIEWMNTQLYLQLQVKIRNTSNLVYCTKMSL